jgi:broad specificity phosphatase PhoE
MELWLVRHGETEWSADGRHTGRTDVALTAEGELQARGIGVVLGERAFDHVLTSDLARARETARLAGYGARAEVLVELGEVEYGEFEGRTTEEIRSTRPEWELFRDGSPGGESPDAMWRAAGELLTRLERRGGNLLLFGHGHRFRALAARYVGPSLALATRLRFDAGAISILLDARDGPTVALWNRRVEPRPVLVAELATGVPEAPG